MSGDISKLFRNEPVKSPGILRQQAPPSEASVLAREVIQNSWDSALEVQDALGSRAGGSGDSGDDEANVRPGFQLDFQFRQLLNTEKEELVRALSLQDLAAEKRGCEALSATAGDDPNRAHKKLGLPADSCLDNLGDVSAPLRILVITETGTTGMYGPWGKDSRMYLALASMGYTPKKAGGGSFGYGKAGMIRCSATRTVIAYSCFERRRDDPGVTRRLFGMTYWGEHETDRGHFVGFARFGSVDSDSSVRPFENEHADEVATSMGLPVRDPDRPNDFGTTFLVVDPVVKPDDLCRAVERNWWPALEDPELDFSVVINTITDETLIPRPKKDEVLKSFIRAYEVATVPQDNPQPHERLFVMRSPGKGVLGLLADLEGWSYPESSGTVVAHRMHRSVVALMRRPRMVVEYLEVGRRTTRPLVRGVFVADDEIDKALRDTEPKAHDCWQTEPGEVADETATEVARHVLANTKSNVATFRRSLKPPPRPAEEIVLPLFNDKMRQLIKLHSGQAPPPAGYRPFTISVTPLAETVGNDRIRVSGQAEFGLADDFDQEVSRVRIRLRYTLVEDGTAGTEVTLRVEPPPGFELGERPGTFEGELQTDSTATFDFVSEEHSALWTGRFTAEAIEQVDPVA